MAADVAGAILEAAGSKFEQECKENACTVTITMHGTFPYTVEVVPAGKDVLVRYKATTFRVARKDTASFDEVLEYVLGAVRDKSMAACEELEERFAASEIDFDPYYCRGAASLRITHHQEEMVKHHFHASGVVEEGKRYMRILRLLA